MSRGFESAYVETAGVDADTITSEWVKTAIITGDSTLRCVFVLVEFSAAAGFAKIYHHYLVSLVITADPFGTIKVFRTNIVCNIKASPKYSTVEQNHRWQMFNDQKPLRACCLYAIVVRFKHLGVAVKLISPE
jgi:hypothetical protein